MPSRIIVALFTLLPLLAGCPSGNYSPGKGAAKARAKPAAGARMALKEMVAAYGRTGEYADKGVIRLSFKQGGKKQGESWPCSLAYDAPNRLSLHAFQVTVVCDGESLHADIEDEATHNLDGQMVERPAPKKLGLAHLSNDAVLYDLLTSRLGRLPIQLDLLLANAALGRLLSEAEARSLEPAEFEQHWCDRVVARLEEGEYTFWIDQEDRLLRRLEYPVAAIFPDLGADKEVRELTLSAELHGATFGHVKNTEFAYVPPRNAKPVEAFVTPPPPAPTALLGKQKADFSFQDLEGQPLSPATWADQAVVLLWYGHHPASEAALQQFAEVRAKYRDESKLRFLAVCAEPSDKTAAEIAQQLESWGINEQETVRDLGAAGRDLFDVTELPTLVILDDQNVVQYVERGVNRELAQTLPRVLERLLLGDNLAQEVLDRAAADRKAYEALIAKGGAATTDVIEVPQATIKSASPPMALKLRELWTLADINQPGNLIIMPRANEEEAAGEILVCEAHRGIARVSPEGKLLGRQQLELPPSTACTQVRAIADAEGKQFYAIFGPFGAQCLLFDSEWKRLLAYPPAEQKHDGIRDVRLADLDNDGTPECYVGFWGVAGVHGLNLEGERLWINRDYSAITSLAVSTPNEIGWRRLLVTGDSGGILKVNKLGHQDPELRVKQWQIGQLVSADFTAQQAQYLGLSQDDQTKQLVAVALNADFQPQWDYPLPAGVHSHPLDFLQPAAILQDKPGAWLLAGADGTIHVVSEDGEFSDSFAIGAPITGLAGGQLGGQRVLIVATEKGLTAWEVQ